MSHKKPAFLSRKVDSEGRYVLRDLDSRNGTYLDGRRLERDETERPLLSGSDWRQRIGELLAEREDGYARFEQVETDGRTPREIVEDLLERLGVRSR